MIGKIPLRAARLAATILAAGATCALTAGAASASEVVYNSVPSPTPGNVVSVGFEATSAAEFGGLVKLEGTARKNPTITALMSSWACQQGTWNAFTCQTESGAKFEWPITFKVYAVGPGDTVGALLASGSKVFKIPYRPSANTKKCTGAQTGKWFSKGVCYSGKAAKITLPALRVANLPDEVIVSVAYNTSHHGYAPVGEATACFKEPQGCPYDSLNLGITETSEVEPTVGSDPLPNDVFWNTTVGGFYCDGGTGGTGTFRRDEGCWPKEQPMFIIKAS